MIIDYTMVTYDGLVSLANQVRYCEANNIPGDYVECGSWRGGASALMASMNLVYSEKRRNIHILDSFEGLPEPNAQYDDIQFCKKQFYVDDSQCTGRLNPINALSADRSDCEKVMFEIVKYPSEYITFHEGWFQDTLEKACTEIDEIAILRLDGDLYESTLICLEYLFPKVITGGFIVIDDWCLSGCRKAIEQYFSDNNVNYYINYVDACVRYFIKI